MLTQSYCKGFGSIQFHSLLEPITRRHPFKLMVADSLSMPKGKTYGNLCNLFKASETFMVDGGREFDNKELREELECAKARDQARNMPSLLPWVNGLLEGMNARVLDRLKRMCAPNLEEDEYSTMGQTTWRPRIATLL